MPFFAKSDTSFFSNDCFMLRSYEEIAKPARLKMKRTEKDLQKSFFETNFAADIKKTAHKCCNFQIKCLSLCRGFVRDCDIEESN